jgi:hypothetical protein
MGLSSYPMRTSLAVADITRAADYYEGKLGLARGGEQSDQSRRYAHGDGTSRHVEERTAP